MDDAERQYKLGLNHCNRKKRSFDFDLAKNYFEGAIRLNPDIERYHRELGKLYAAAHLLAITRGINHSVPIEQYTELAINELEQARELDSSQVETYLVLGEIYMYTGKNQQAEEAFQTAVIATSMPFTFLYPGSFIDGLLLKSYAKRRLKHLQQDNGRQVDAKMAINCLEQAKVCRNRAQYNLADKQLLSAFQFTPNWAWLHKTICKLAN